MTIIKKMTDKLLKEIYSIKHKDFIKAYSKVKKRKSNISINRRTSNIIIAPFMFDNTHAFEALFARKAILEGKKVYSFLCGQGVDYCEKKESRAKLNGIKNSIKCKICNQTQRDYIDMFETEGYFIGDGINQTHINMINDYIIRNNNQSGNFESFLGVDVNKVLYSALQRYYFEAEPNTEANDVTNGFLQTILRTLIEFDNLCKIVNPEYVLISHGTYSSWGSILEYCKVKKIRVIVWGRMYNKYGIYFSEDESYLVEMVIGNNEPWINKNLSINNENLIKGFLDMRTSQKPVNFLYDYNKNQKKYMTEEEIRKLYGIPESAKIVGMYANIPWDGSVSGVSVEAFSSYRVWLYNTIRYFSSHNDTYLLIRTHPAEVATDAEIGRETLRTLIDEMDFDLPRNIIIIPADSKVNSFAIGKASLFGIFYCSTVGMELTYLNVPLICVGPSPLRNKNIVYDARNKEHYTELLDQGLQGKLHVTNSMKENLIKFSYYNMFTRVMPETLIQYEESIFNEIPFNDEIELLNNPVLNHLFHIIENKESYDFDIFYVKDEVKNTKS